MLSGFDDSAEALTKAKEWQRLLAAGGWAAITWPAALGGRDAGPLEALVWGEELNRYELPTNIFSIGIAMIGPTIMAHGTDRAAVSLPQADGGGPRGVVPALERARRRQRPRVALVQSRARR